jgi:hypothetical protein
LVLAHDITEIVPGVCKGPAFKRGHVVADEDIDHLARLGKRHLYVLAIGDDQLHENEAAERMAGALAGDGVCASGPPSEGKITFVAEWDGLFEVDVDRLCRFNQIPEVTCATIHRHTPVKRGQALAGTRAIPLVARRRCIDEACAVASVDGGLLCVSRFRRMKAGVVVTGNEVAEGLVEDRFIPLIRRKLEGLGSGVIGARIVPDDRPAVSGAITDLVDLGAELIVTTAGMSVDPDDITRDAIGDAGAYDLVYGAPVLPGSMFLVGSIAGPAGEVPILGAPACALFFETTVLDLVLPRVLVGERITREKIAALAHGGFCLQCAGCRFPRCGFGRGS